MRSAERIGASGPSTVAMMLPCSIAAPSRNDGVSTIDASSASNAASASGSPASTPVSFDRKTPRPR